MSAEPPSSDRPTGPPSGPLSDPSQPGATPPPPPPPSGPSEPGPPGPPGGPGSGPGGGPGGTGPGGSREGPGRPWWRSVPGIATIAVALVVAVVLAVVLTRPDGGAGPEAGGSGEVFLQAAGSTGPDPFTESTAKESSPPASTPAAEPGGSTASPNVTRSIEGSAPGLYGGTLKVASCDVEQQIRALGEDPAKNRAFAEVQRIEPARVPALLRSFTPVQLRMDTRVTNHGYQDGEPTAYQAVLQAGTAVLVDDRGVPKVRCACGNPLTPPVAQQDPRTTGDPWPGYRASNVVVVAPADRPVKEFVLRDGDGWIKRPAGDTGTRDEETKPPSGEPSPSADTSPSDETTPPSGRPSEPPASEPPPQEPPPESDPAPESPAEPEQPPSEPAPESGADSPDGPAPDGPAPDEPAPVAPGPGGTAP
ncbi:DUF6777 domain-containing protein [Streptomyces sp. NPDC048389]|uniref:DUF6777 domain-containing protein n=1 Tax=Streptomyces sp. NPDC048389 TaxID=3154622 RepID=UPI003453C2E8